MITTESGTNNTDLADIQCAAERQVFERLERDKARFPPLASLLKALQAGLRDIDIDVNALLRGRPNPDTLMIRFHRDLGESLGDYLEKARLELAIRLLCSTEMTCKAVAEYVGYSSESSFSRAFRRRTTLTAGEFKRSWHSVVARIGVPKVDLHSLMLLEDLRSGELEESDRAGMLDFFENLARLMGASQVAHEPEVEESFFTPDELKARFLEMIQDLPYEDQQAQLRAAVVLGRG